MSADQHSLKPPANGPDPQPAQSSPNKVRSTRYDWAHDIVQVEPSEKPKPGKLTARSSLWRRLIDRLRDLFRSGGNPFDRDDDADPMAA